MACHPSDTWHVETPNLCHSNVWSVYGHPSYPNSNIQLSVKEVEKFTTSFSFEQQQIHITTGCTTWYIMSLPLLTKVCMGCSVPSTPSTDFWFQKHAILSLLQCTIPLIIQHHMVPAPHVTNLLPPSPQNHMPTVGHTRSPSWCLSLMEVSTDYLRLCVGWCFWLYLFMCFNLRSIYYVWGFRVSTQSGWFQVHQGFTYLTIKYYTCSYLWC